MIEREPDVKKILEMPEDKETTAPLVPYTKQQINALREVKINEQFLKPFYFLSKISACQDAYERERSWQNIADEDGSCAERPADRLREIDCRHTAGGNLCMHCEFYCLHFIQLFID